MECGSMYEEIDDELHESFKENTKVIKEMFNRFSKFN
jgi:ribosomal protein S17E